MQRGDLSDAQSPRVLFQWEGLVAIPARRRQSFWRRRGWDVFAMEPHPHIRRILWDASSRRGWRIDLFTAWPTDHVSEITQWVEMHDLPVRRVLAYQPEALERDLLRMPYVLAVVHAGDGRPMAFGGRGIYVHDLDRMVKL